MNIFHFDWIYGHDKKGMIFLTRIKKRLITFRVVKGKLIFLFTIVSLSCFAQTDSTENKLQHYKDLHEKNLISDQEYETLRKKELNILDVPPAKKDTVNLDALKKKSKTKFISGGVLTGMGIAVLTYGVYLWRNSDTVVFDANGKPSIQKFKPAKFIIATGAGISAIGVVFFISGAVTHAKYIDKISVSPTSASISFRF